MSLRVQQQAAATGPITVPKIATPCWGSAAPRMGPGTPSNHLGGPVAPRRVLFPPAGCVRSPIWPPNSPKRGPRAPGRAPVGSGGRVLGWNPLGQRVGWILLVFYPFLPCQRCGVIWPQTGPKTAANGPQQSPMAPGHAPPGSGGRIWGRSPLGHRATCLLVMFCLFLSRKWCDLAPKQPHDGPQWTQNGSKMGTKTAQNFQK